MGQAYRMLQQAHQRYRFEEPYELKPFLDFRETLQ